MTGGPSHDAISGGRGTDTLIGGKGKVFVNRIVPGFMAEKRHYDGAMHIFKKYPGIELQYARADESHHARAHLSGYQEVPSLL